MYEVTYNVNNYYFYCRIRREGLLYDAERGVLAIAKFLFDFTWFHLNSFPARTFHCYSQILRSIREASKHSLKVKV